MSTKQNEQICRYAHTMSSASILGAITRFVTAKDTWDYLVAILLVGIGYILFWEGLAFCREKK